MSDMSDFKMTCPICGSWTNIFPGESCSNCGWSPEDHLERSYPVNANQTLKQILKQLLEAGKDVPSRVGDTKELAFINFSVTNPQDRYITLPGRKVSVPAQIAETMWVLAGRNDTDWLANYLPQAPKFADDGKHWRAGYGPRLRKFKGKADQLKNFIQLLKDDPTTRRAVISIWDPTDDTTPSKDIPCNNWLHFLCRAGKLHLNIATRSNDVMWGWSGINFFEWSVLLEIVAKHAGLPVGDLHFNVSSMHLYERHFEKAKRILSTPWEKLRDPNLTTVTYGGNADLDESIALWFRIEEEIRVYGNIQNIGTMKDGLLWSWLWAIAYYWGHEETAERMLRGLDILPALELSPKRKKPLDLDPLIKIMTDLHTEKSAAYGDSWKKRGELFSIIPNIARKVDRILANTETSDETKLDTAMDLVIYLAKYRHWLAFPDTTTTESENARIADIVRSPYTTNGVKADSFEALLSAVEEGQEGFKIDQLEYFTAQAVGYLIKLWTGPEGRALRNEKRSWNPESPNHHYVIGAEPSREFSFAEMAGKITDA
jgi:thymidylate synthase